MTDNKKPTPAAPSTEVARGDQAAQGEVGRAARIDREMTAELDRRRVLTLAKLSLLLDQMATDGMSVYGIGTTYDIEELHGETLMALGIEDEDSPDAMAAVIVEMDGKSGHGILERSTPASDVPPIASSGHQCGSCGKALTVDSPPCDCRGPVPGFDPDLTDCDGPSGGGRFYHPALAAYTPKTPPAASSGQDLREAFVRIIYPEIFEPETPQSNRVYRNMGYYEAHADARAKADEFLALLSAPAVQPGGDLVVFIRCASCGGEFDEGEWDAASKCPECEQPKRKAGRRKSHGRSRRGETLDDACKRLTRESINESLAEIGQKFDDLFSDRDEWREQHENLLSVRQSDLAALAAATPQPEAEEGA